MVNEHFWNRIWFGMGNLITISFICDFSSSSNNSKSNSSKLMFSVGNRMFTFMECRECQFKACKQCKGSACKDYRKINSYQFNQIIHSSNNNNSSNKNLIECQHANRNWQRHLCVILVKCLKCIAFGARLNELFPVLVTTSDLYNGIQTELPFKIQFNNLKNRNVCCQKNIRVCNTFWHWTHHLYQSNSHFKNTHWEVHWND